MSPPRPGWLARLDRWPSAQLAQRDHLDLHPERHVLLLDGRDPLFVKKGDQYFGVKPPGRIMSELRLAGNSRPTKLENS